MAQDLIFTKPIFHEKIWGGRRLDTVFHYDIPEGAIGECWAISAHPAGDCEVVSGPFAGSSLSQLWDEHHELFGHAEGDRFPLLIKILDADGDLSIQVHPDDEYARVHERGSLGKCECWYVLDCDEDATIIVGQKAKDREEFAKLVEEGRWSDLVNEVPIHKGDFFQIDPGTIHAIKAGTTILETQQSSDVTYRVYDYDRVQADGSLRELHLEPAIETLHYDKSEMVNSAKPTTVELPGMKRTTLVSNDSFTVEKLEVTGPAELEAGPYELVTVARGAGRANGEDITVGDQFLLPRGESLSLDGDVTLFMTTA